MFAALGTAALPAASISASPAGAKPPMMLHVDMLVEPGREEALKETFSKVFRPAIRKQAGFVDVKLMKFRLARVGNSPPSGAWKLLISFETEEQREKWVASADHQRVWPEMEKHLKMVNALVYDLV
jgi:heme-degrading monooxygenase HmoA